jgi:poly-beta-1,6-N-acetyl-D-glucosamine synthase
MVSTRYVVISPVRDEVNYIQRTIDSMLSQTHLPAQWIIVDDGSTDGTRELLDRYVNRSWITVVHRADRGHRASGGGVVEAFNTGYALLRDNDWDFIVKLDGDLSFEADYFEKCIELFHLDESLGIGGGTVCRMEGDHVEVDSMGDPPFHVRGASKVYRRACWERIGPLAITPGWDTIDEVKANLHGWKSRTFNELRIIQHKPTGSADGRWRNWFKNGYANYMTGYHPVFMLAKCIKRIGRSPVFVESTALWAGFCSGYIKRVPQACSRDVIQYLRKQQIRRLLQRPSIYR